MEDEVFEEVFEKIEKVFHFGVYFDDCRDPDGSYTWDETERKQKLKEILEELIENNQTTWAVRYPKNMKR